ncbi:MAG: hypothetical protein KDA87_18970, partial [Planctomycetales bacterium]|nr:hypothetical protein [Planctomycetales bacterium]
NALEPEEAWSEEEIISDHPGGANGLYCDNAVKFMADSMELRVLLAICSRNGREGLEEQALE